MFVADSIDVVYVLMTTTTMKRMVRLRKGMLMASMMAMTTIPMMKGNQAHVPFTVNVPLFSMRALFRLVFS